MKKVKILLVIIYFIILAFPLELHAEEESGETPTGVSYSVDYASDYLTYQEIILSSGKLIKNITQEERAEIFATSKFSGWFNVEIMHYCNNVPGTYIATVKECMENAGSTDITIKVDYSVETNTKVSYSASCSISNSFNLVAGKIKEEAAAKSNVEITDQTTKSVKEKRSLDITVEPNSQYMVVVKGTLSISNGATKAYMFGVAYATGLFEIVTLESQYAVLEKRMINE